MSERAVMVVGGHRLHVVDLAPGDEPAIVLLHGFGASSTTWTTLVPEVRRTTGRRLLAFDRLGFGRSDRPRRGAWTGPSPYRSSVSGAHTIAVLDALGLERAVLVGHSAGAVAAVLATLAAPERVAALGLLAPALLRDGPPPFVSAAFRLPGAGALAPALLRRSAGLLDRGLRRTWHDPAKVTHEVLERYREPLRSPGWEHALVEMTAAVERLDLSGRLPTITTPSIVLGGRSDRIVPLRDVRRVGDLLGGPTTTLVIEGAGHVVHEEQPRAVADALGEFVD